jgi:hypothetical protein
MSLALTSARDAARDEWDAAWRACPASTFFHSRTWAEIWQTYTHGRMTPAARHISFSDGQSVVLPLSLERLWHGVATNAWLSPASTYGGWLGPTTLTPEHARLLRDYVARSFGSRFWRLNPFDRLSAVLEHEAMLPDETQAIRLSSDADAVFHRSHSTHRTAVRKAERLGTECREAADLAEWRAYYDVYLDSLRRWGDTVSSRYGWQLFAALHDCGSPNVKLWLAVLDGRVISGDLCLYASRHVVSWHSASLADSLRDRPADFLKACNIRDACERGFDWFDFNPSGGHEGVRNFKTKLGGVARPASVLYAPSGSFVRLRRLTGAAARIASRHSSGKRP